MATAVAATTAGGGFKEALLYGWKWIQFAGLLHCTQEYIFDFSTTQGGSMEPSIRSEGCVLFYDKVFPRLKGYSKGDVVIATAPHGGHQICKRIAGVAGDKVPVHRRGKEVYFRIPPGHVWLLGDNPEKSLDSRAYGPVPEALLKGRVRAKVWPPSQWARFSDNHCMTAAATTTTTTALFDVDTLALLLTLFVIYSNSIKRRKWWMDVSLEPSSLLVYHKDQRSSSSSTGLARLGEVSDTITGATPGRGVEQLPYFFSLEVIMFTPMALGVSLGVVTLTRYFTGRRNPYSPFFLGAVLCMAFPVLLSAWRAARSSNGNQVASLLAALIITPIACFNTSALFGVDPPQPNFPLSPEQQALLNDLGMEKLVPILRGVAHTMLYVGLLLAVYTIVGYSQRSEQQQQQLGRENLSSRQTCNSICHDTPLEDAAESVNEAPSATRERLILYFVFLAPMAIPLFISPLTSPLPSAVSSLSEFITCCLAIFIVDFRFYMMFPGVVQHWLLSRADGAAAGGGLELETRYMRALYTAFECAVVPRFITVFIELDMTLRIIPTNTKNTQGHQCGMVYGVATCGGYEVVQDLRWDVDTCLGGDHL
ncbi:hypothetical protein FOL46_003095 [Perkinsus olseni]|uniref:Peptidase S26 domain-containing protein n=1 Tax=Perkinsus olseni TaxID=32597 RepID=A0A7J6M4F9_PEROL|nr:hypothetical protein FOL46_003095 [Perkinsus olseni]